MENNFRSPRNQIHESNDKDCLIDFEPTSLLIPAMQSDKGLSGCATSQITLSTDTNAIGLGSQELQLSQPQMEVTVNSAAEVANLENNSSVSDDVYSPVIVEEEEIYLDDNDEEPWPFHPCNVEQENVEINIDPSDGNEISFLDDNQAQSCPNKSGLTIFDHVNAKTKLSSVVTPYNQANSTAANKNITGNIAFKTLQSTNEGSCVKTMVQNKFEDAVISAENFNNFGNEEKSALKVSAVTDLLDESQHKSVPQDETIALFSNAAEKNLSTEDQYKPLVLHTKIGFAVDKTEGKDLTKKNSVQFESTVSEVTISPVNNPVIDNFLWNIPETIFETSDSPKNVSEVASRSHDITVAGNVQNDNGTFNEVIYDSYTGGSSKCIETLQNDAVVSSSNRVDSSSLGIISKCDNAVDDDEVKVDSAVTEEKRVFSTEASAPFDNCCANLGVDDLDDDEENVNSDADFLEKQSVQHDISISKENPSFLPDDETHSSENKEMKLKPDKFFTRRFLKYQVPPSALQPLPEGWVTLTHSTGAQFYLHKETSVATWSRPYSLNSSGRFVKQHSVPVTSIPCLYYQMTKEKMEKAANNESTSNGNKSGREESDDLQKASHNNKGDGENNPEPEHSAASSALLHDNITHSLSESEFRDYLEKRFDFCEKEIPYFSEWSRKREYQRLLQRANKSKRTAKKAMSGDSKSADDDAPKSATVGKIITLTLPRDGSGARPRKLSFNTSVKPMISILHEYLQLTLREKPVYSFSTRDSVTDPYVVNILIDGTDHGSGSGASKKVAKNKAAIEALDKLIPGFKTKVQGTENASEDLAEFFDGIAVDDKRVYELCLNTGTFLPHELLSECLKRNQKVTNVQSNFEVIKGKGKMIEYVMSCGKHVITGTARNKKIGKQEASQRMLQLLHPQAKTWGELSRLYGSSVADKLKRKQELEEEILELKERTIRFPKPLVSVDDAPPESSETTKENSGQRSSETKSDAMIANPELLAKLKSVMLSLGKERGLLGDERKKREKERDNEEMKRKKRKLLLIDV